MASPDQIEQIRFAAGEILFREHEQSFHFFIVQEGEIEVFKDGADGQPIVLATLGPGNSLGEFAMLDRQPRSASARALSNVTVAKVSAEAYEDLIAELPEWAVSVMQALVERLRATNDIVRKLLPTSTAAEAIHSAEYQDSSIRLPISSSGGRTAAADSSGDTPGNKSDDTVTMSEFDFSIYDSSQPKDTKLKR